MRLPKTTTKKARIEIIPMIDAIFFLLVFFMFSSLSMVKMNGLPVALPKAPTAAASAEKPGGNVASSRRTATARIPSTPRRLVLEIQPGSETTVDGATVATDDAVARSLTTRLRTEPDAVVVVRAAKGVSAQRLIGVMDALNRVSLPEGKRPQIVVATVAEPPTNRSNVLPVVGAEGDSARNVR
ncbi:MAG: biopolymer transporter ExbD [Akkermansiaceae bacterium]|nr:biopolymer transporter ExbD [Armatimonadota bacterium]